MPLSATLRPRLITSRRSSGAIGDGVAVAVIGVGAAIATATAVTGVGVALAAGIGGGAAADGGAGRLPDRRDNIETDRTGGGAGPLILQQWQRMSAAAIFGSRAVRDGPCAAPAPWPPA